ncbi:MAG: DUF1697 domain-containing protein [Planctomycetaceae bacterium]
MKYAAFLSGINVGKRRVKMPVLAEVFEELGHQNVATFIASGNVIFQSNKRKQSLIEDNAGDALRQRLGYEVNVFVRSFDDLKTIANAETLDEHESGQSTINVAFMRNELDAKTADKLESVRTEHDSFRVIGREFYWICTTRISESKVWALPETKSIQLPRNTVRNITTIRRLVSKFFTD